MTELTKDELWTLAVAYRDADNRYKALKLANREVLSKDAMPKWQMMEVSGRDKACSLLLQAINPARVEEIA